MSAIENDPKFQRITEAHAKNLMNSYKRPEPKRKEPEELSVKWFEDRKFPVSFYPGEGVSINLMNEGSMFQPYGRLYINKGKVPTGINLLGNVNYIASSVSFEDVKRLSQLKEIWLRETGKDFDENFYLRYAELRKNIFENGPERDR